MDNSTPILSDRVTSIQTRYSAAAGPEDPDPQRAALVEQWAQWINDFAAWRSFITLTVANEKWCSKEGAQKRWRTLLQVLNNDLYGKHYVKIVGHSYFAYAVGYEFTSAGVVHLHALVDRPVNFALIHSVWNAMSGWAYIKPVTDIRGIAEYIVKYVVKRQDLDLWKPKKIKPPRFIPLWFIE